MEKGKLNWVFCDGDLPPKDPTGMQAHESLMILNLNDEDAVVKATILFEDREPEYDIELKVDARRVRCFRLDGIIGDGEKKYQIPFGQYALHIKSSVPVCACFGRLDVRQSNMAYYALSGYAF